MDPVLTACSDVEILALTLFGEARGEGPEGRLAVANVLRNRVAAQRKAWGLTLRDACLAPLQFSCWNESDPNRGLLLDTAAAIHAGRIGPILRECLWIAQGAVDGSFVDSTHGACNYLTTDLYQHHPPAWALKGRVLATIGRHVFIGDVA